MRNSSVCMYGVLNLTVRVDTVLGFATCVEHWNLLFVLDMVLNSVVFVEYGF